MATYRYPGDDEVDPDSPVTSELMTALRDNLEAVIEGDPSAPSLAGGYAASITGAGIVGAQVLAVLDFNADTEVLQGQTVPGSSLLPCCIRLIGRTRDATAQDTTYEIDPLEGVQVQYRDPDTTGIFSGTWRCMGYAFTDNDGGDTIYAATMFLRIA